LVGDAVKTVKAPFARTLTTEMAARGYAPIAMSMPMQTVYAFERAINPEMRCYIAFRYMASPKAYDVSVGVGSVDLQSDVEKALEEFSALAGGLAYTSAKSSTTCVLFNADVFTKQDFGEVLQAKTEQVKPYLDVLFANAVQPIFEIVSDKKKLLHLLLRMDQPFNRFFNMRRVLFIAKLVCITKTEWTPIRDQLQKIEGALRNDAYIEKYPGPLIDDAYAYFAKKGSCEKGVRHH
jgi:hypothetical protein